MYYIEKKKNIIVFLEKKNTKFKITQCFENNKGAEKVEVNYERLKNPKKMFRPQESNWPHQSEIRLRSGKSFTSTENVFKKPHNPWKSRNLFEKSSFCL
jgi:hypothetical protein